MADSTVERKRPEHFYKYMSRQTAKIVLTNRTLRWSTPALLNDPFDVQFDLHLNNIDRQRIKALALPKVWDILYGEGPYQPKNKLGAKMAQLRGRMKPMSQQEFYNRHGPAIDAGIDNLLKHLPKHQEGIRKHMAKAKVICFSEVPDSILMWAYYAEQQKGTVLRFHANEEVDSPLLMAQPLNYSKHVPPLVTDEFLADMSSGVAEMSAEALLNQMTTTKALEWAHEREWRLTLGYGREPHAPFEDISFHSKELEGVIFGCLTPSDDVQMLSAIIKEKYPHAMLQKAVKAHGEFKLLIRDLDE